MIYDITTYGTNNRVTINYQFKPIQDKRRLIYQALDLHDVSSGSAPQTLLWISKQDLTNDEVKNFLNILSFKKL